MRRLLASIVALLIAQPVFAAGSELIDAVKRQDVAAVRQLLSRPDLKRQASSLSVNDTQSDGFTALHWAVLRDNAQLVDLLLKAGADAKAITRYNVTPLYLAANNGNAAIIGRLLDAGADPNGTAYEGQTMLMTAALAGKADAVRLLLTRGANVDVVEPYKGQTALMWAAAEGNTAAVDVLLEAGARLDAKSTGGFTPFLFAVRNAHIDTAVTLLKHGANVNEIAPDGSSALSMATVNAYYELASVLLDHGANPNLPDPRASPLHAVAWLRKPGADGAAGVGNTPQGTPAPTGNMSALTLARKLLEHGANPNARVDWREPTFGKEGGTARNPPNIRLGRHLLSYNGATPFYIAAKNGDVELMKLLVEFKANPKTPSRYGITPLMVAAGLDYWEGEAPGPFTGVPEAERLAAVTLALDLGNDVNAHASFGDYRMDGDVEYTLLYYPHNIDDLLTLGVGDPRWNGSTALIGAVVSGQASIVQFLVDRGADVNATTALGWTPLKVAEGVFFANAKKEFPQAAAILRKAGATR
ncbi:MAG TPA: ankyrin repeat domain-containing protein [Vicinamibacterales bacterium]|nr:ankyrin repeat domain-containing protein [Vicinamibacterales bacterium]